MSHKYVYIYKENPFDRNEWYTSGPIIIWLSPLSLKFSNLCDYRYQLLKNFPRESFILLCFDFYVLIRVLLINLVLSLMFYIVYKNN